MSILKTKKKKEILEGQEKLGGEVIIREKGLLRLNYPKKKQFLK